MFGALRGRDFRLFWAGAFVSNIGSWIQSIALSWLVFQLTNSSFALGLVNFASTVPILLFSLIGGVYVDRTDRRRLLMITQTLLLVLAIALAAISFAGIARLEYIIIITLLSGTVLAANSPAWQAFIVDLVDAKDLPTAIALNSTQFNLSRVAGPSVAGILLAIIGAAGCFFINGLSYLAVIIALIFIRPRQAAQKLDDGSVWNRLWAGLTYTIRDPVVNSIIALTSVMTVFGFPYAVLMPVMAQDVLGVGADGYGAMMAATGVGAIIASLIVASWGQRFARGQILLFSEMGFAIVLVAFSMSRVFALSAVLLALLGFCMIIYMTTANTAIQMLTPNDLRGRVMSIWVLVSFGFSPIGSLLSGAVAQQWGAPLALGIGGVICAIAAISTALFRPALRQLPVSLPPEPTSRPSPITPASETSPRLPPRTAQ